MEHKTFNPSEPAAAKAFDALVAHLGADTLLMFLDRAAAGELFQITPKVGISESEQPWVVTGDRAQLSFRYGRQAPHQLTQQAARALIKEAAPPAA